MFKPVFSNIRRKQDMDSEKSVALAMRETISSEHLNVLEDIGEVVFDTTLNEGLLVMVKK